jgi:2-keto-4-pentenoate hydratase
MRHDLAAGASREEVMVAVGEFLPAIELADADLPFTDPVPILAGNIFQRHYVLGAPVTQGWGDGPEQLSGLVTVHEGDQHVTDTQELTGQVVENLAHLALVAQAYGRGLGANDIVLLGSVVPPVPLNIGDSFTFELSSSDVSSTVSVTVR